MFFVTNSSISTRAQYAQKIQTLLGLSFEISENCILSAAFVTANYLAERLPQGAKLFVMGMEGIQQELQAKGFDIIPGSGDVSADIAAVVVGFDPSFTYNHMSKACKLFTLNPECMFIGCNLDHCYVNESNYLQPGTGALVTAVAYGSGKDPIIMGKPNNFLFDALLSAW